MPATKTTAANVDPKLLDDVIDYMKQYVIFADEAHADVLALWVLHTHTFDAAYCTPYIYVTSAEKQSGKTRTIEVLETIAHNPIRSAGSTEATLYRDVEQNRPTIFMDEVDAVWTGASNEGLRGLLNTGYKTGGSTRRVVPGADGGEVRSFSTYCPKLLAGIDNGAIPDTIADRSIRIVLKRKKGEQEVQRFMFRKVEPQAAALIERIEKWAALNLPILVDAEPAPIEEISDRAFEISEPLLAIAARFRGWNDRARAALVHLLRGEDVKLSPGARALTAARDIMGERGEDRILSDRLASAMDVSQKKLSEILRPYGITPSTIRTPDGRGKGYHRADFADAWDRYL